VILNRFGLLCIVWFYLHHFTFQILFKCNCCFASFVIICTYATGDRRARPTWIFRLASDTLKTYSHNCKKLQSVNHCFRKFRLQILNHSQLLRKCLLILSFFVIYVKINSSLNSTNLYYFIEEYEKKYVSSMSICTKFSMITKSSSPDTPL